MIESFAQDTFLPRKRRRSFLRGRSSVRTWPQAQAFVILCKECVPFALGFCGCCFGTRKERLVDMPRSSAYAGREVHLPKRDFRKQYDSRCRIYNCTFVPLRNGRRLFWEKPFRENLKNEDKEINFRLLSLFKTAMKSRWSTFWRRSERRTNNLTIRRKDKAVLCREHSTPKGNRRTLRHSAAQIPWRKEETDD